MLLQLDKVCKSFGALQVINEVSFDLEDGVALGIMGPNGAGKTTLLNLISGDLPITSGKVFFDGRDLTGVSAEQRCLSGIGRTSQIPRPFTGMTVYENVLVAAMYGSNLTEKEAEATCVDVLKQTGLLPRWNVEAGQLRLLERKRLELARAMATKPRLLLLDEIAGGLTDHEVQELLELIKDIRSQGITIIWIEHIVHALVSVVDRIVAIDFGNKLAEGTPDEVINSDAFKQVYFGVESVKLG
ncbi:MAG: ABC transporter ATP-binding protein [Chloroflexota bacterium]